MRALRLTGTTFEQANDLLQRRGYSFDFISDAQLHTVKIVGGRLITAGGGSYSTVVIPRCRYIPLETFEKVLSLARAGATIVSMSGWPDDISGLDDIDARRARFQALRDSVKFGSKAGGGVTAASVGRGRILQGTDLDGLVARAGAVREPLVDGGLQFVRRRHSGGKSYFLLNPADTEVDSWVQLAGPARHAVLFDPATGEFGDAQLRRSPAGTLEIHLTIPPSGSVIVQTTDTPIGRRHPSYTNAGDASRSTDRGSCASRAAARRFQRSGRSIASDRGRPAGGDDVKAFAGTAVYSTTFSRPSGPPMRGVSISAACTRALAYGSTAGRLAL